MENEKVTKGNPSGLTELHMSRLRERNLKRRDGNRMDGKGEWLW